MDSYLLQRLRCPDCRKRLIEGSTFFRCDGCGRKFPVLDCAPVLIRNDNELFPLESYTDKRRLRKSTIGSLRRLLPSPSVNLRVKENLRLFVKNLVEEKASYILVVGSGYQKSWLDRFFRKYPNVKLVYSDVDSAATVDLFHDAHEIPFVDRVFSGLIATAVLEHMLYPEQVVKEFHRVLVDGGVLYSEIPFLQPVHEGAYDFTRYTLSGHRRLFNQFRELKSGLVAGPGTTLVWVMEYLLLCVVSGTMLRLFAKGAVRLLLGWMKYFDYLLEHSRAAVDVASCTFFLGRKEPNYRTPDRVIVDDYRGAQVMRHV